jgi:hypothetical protein
VTEWLIAIHLAGKHGSDQKIIFSPPVPNYSSNKIDHRKFHLVLLQNLLEISTREPHPQSNPTGGLNPQASQMKCLEA